MECAGSQAARECLFEKWLDAHLPSPHLRIGGESVFNENELAHASECPSWMARSSRISPKEKPRVLARLTNARRRSRRRTKQSLLLIKMHSFWIDLGALGEIQTADVSGFGAAIETANLTA